MTQTIAAIDREAIGRTAVWPEIHRYILGTPEVLPNGKRRYRGAVGVGWGAAIGHPT